MGKNKIVQSNYLIDKKGKMNIDEQRVFYSMLRLIRKEDTDFRRMDIPIKDIYADWGLAEKGYNKRVIDAAEALSKRSIRDIVIDEDGREKERIIPLISYAEHVKGSGILTVQIHEAMKPYLLELSENFTQLYFDEIKVLSSQSMRLYEVISKYRWVKMWTATPEQFKQAMFIDLEKYPRTNDLEKRVIIPCLKEINEKIRTKVSYEKHGRGDEAVFVFSIKSPKEAEAVKMTEAMGTYGNVILSEGELSEFKKAYPEKWQEKINNLSSYMKKTGKKYASHYAVLIDWAEKDDADKNKPYYGPNGVLIDPTMDDLRGYF